MSRFPSDIGVSIPLASADSDGIMSSADKIKLDALQVGGNGQYTSATISIQRANGNIPDSDIVLFASECSRAELPLASTCTRQYILFHNTTKRTVIVAANSRNEIFGYPTGVGIPHNESVQVVLEPDSSLWRVL